MATYTFDKIEYGGNNYIVQDSGALQLTGGQVTGPVSFGDGITVDEATLGDLVVNGSASFTNNLQANTINGVTVGNSPVFTDEKVATAVGSSGTYYPTFGTNTTIAETKLYDTNFRYFITEGTTTVDGKSGLVLGNFTKSGVAGNRQGQIQFRGLNNTASTLLGPLEVSTNNTEYQIVLPAESGTVLLGKLNYTTSDNNRAVQKDNNGNLYVVQKDEKLKVAEVTSGTQYFPIVGTGTLAATRQYDTTGFVYIGRTGTTSTVGDATLVLGNSTASGTAGNKRGELHIFGKNSHYAYIILGEPSSDIQLNLPITDGTLALTSDIPSNIVTGTGTSGYLAKFNGTSTITNGPQLGNGTTTFLRNDGSWATPTETDPTVPSWAKEVNKPSYSANEISGLLDFFYPVGSYYETSDTTFDPNTSWGGTWELEAAGQVHVSAGTGYTVAGALTNTTDGGSKDAIIPSHNHTATGAAVAKHSATACSRTTNVGLDNNHNVSVTNSRTTTESGGGSHSHSPSTTTRSFLTATTSGISINRSNIKNGTGTQYDGCLRVGSACAYNGSTDSVSISHSHYFTPSVSVTVKGHNITQPAFSTPELTHTVTQPTISTEGVSVTGKNMQPYIIVNRWHRTA